MIPHIKKRERDRKREREREKKMERKKEIESELEKIRNSLELLLMFHNKHLIKIQTA